MTAPNIPAWLTGQTGSLRGFSTLTRFTDIANNSDKYRRFILIWDANGTDRKILVTQTGRWSRDAALGTWSGGSYRFADYCHTQTAKRAEPAQWLATLVDRKKGSYTLDNGHFQEGMSQAQIRFALDRAIKKANADTSSGVSVNPPSTPQPAAPSRPGLDAPIGDQVAWLARAAADPGSDQMALLAAYSPINDLLKTRKAAIDAAADELATTLQVILLK